MTSSKHLIIITGTSRGIGAALVQALLQPDNYLVCVARSGNPDLERMASESGVPAFWHQQDLSQPGPAATWLAGTLDEIDGVPASATLILNAGVVVPIGPIADLREAELVTNLFTNLATPMTMTGAFLKHTERFGCPRKVLAISSGGARQPFDGMSPYSAGKAGLDMFMRSVNIEYAQVPAERAVRAVALAPGAVDTPMQNTIRSTDFSNAEKFRNRKQKGELVSADEIGVKIVAYLARPDFGSKEIDDIRNY